MPRKRQVCSSGSRTSAGFGTLDPPSSYIQLFWRLSFPPRWRVLLTGALSALHGDGALQVNKVLEFVAVDPNVEGKPAQVSS
jgi:hypothetical protein